MISCYEYVAPLFIFLSLFSFFCLPHLTYSFFFLFRLSKCNRDLYKNVHLLRLIVSIFII